MVHFRQAGYWGILPVLVVAGLVVVAPVLALWDAPLQTWIDAWPVHLLMLSVASWYWFIVGRHLNREVVLDDRGLWIDGDFQVGRRDIIGIGTLQDPASALHLRRLDDAGHEDGRRSLSYWFGAAAWRQRVWTRVLRVEGIGKVAVPRSRDLARGSGWTSVLLVSRRSHGPGRLADYREGWLIGTFRDEELVRAVLAGAPEAQLYEGVPDVRGAG